MLGYFHQEKVVNEVHLQRSDVDIYVLLISVQFRISFDGDIQSLFSHFLADALRELDEEALKRFLGNIETPLCSDPRSWHL